ncbi:MAG TPA: AMP-binding protein [Sphingobacteriaceae bacterium]
MNAFDYFFKTSRSLDKNFVIGPEEEASFKEIYEDSLRIADYLRSVIGQEKNILLIANNSVFFIKVYLAILKSGNICVPVNPLTEQKTIDFITDVTKSKYVFQSESPPFNKKLDGVIKVSDADIKVLRQRQLLNPKTISENFDPDRTAEILFTSGSTGTPKGVELSHRNLCSNTQAITEYLNLSSADIMSVVLPFSYCYGLSLLHTHLRVGGSLVLNNSFIFLGKVISDMKKYRCTGFAGVPSHFQILLRKAASFLGSKLPDLRFVTQAGGKLHDVFIREFLDGFPGVDFFTMYGQTEATARLAYLSPALLPSKAGSVGKAIPGVVLMVVNDQFIPVRAGEIGEIIAKGDNIMKGYYNAPEETKNVMTSGWLHTGDLATIDSEGFIYIVGRKKDIIKVGGRRVSPREIEDVILSVPGVIDCAIEGIYDDLLGEAIRASVVVTERCNRAKTEEKIRKTCIKNLSLYKVPQIICFEDALMLNPSGKKVIRISPNVQLSANP